MEIRTPQFNTSQVRKTEIMAKTPDLWPSISPEDLNQPDDERANAKNPKNAEMSTADYYHLIRGQLEYEDNLVNQRLIWMVFSQSFMFSAFAILLNAPEKPKSPVFGALQDHLILLIPLVALLASLLIYLGIVSSMFSMYGLRRMYHDYPKDETIKRYPALQANLIIRWMANLAPLALPLIFIAIWLFLLIDQLNQQGGQ